MQGFLRLSGLSNLVVVRKVEQRFGFAGYARLIKLLELISSMKPAVDESPLGMPWADVLEALQVDDLRGREFLTYCEDAKALRVTRREGVFEVALCGELVSLMANAPVGLGNVPKLVLFESEREWADWFAADFNCPPYLVNDAYNRQLFRRWCAVNVTVAEIEAAVELAIGAKEAPHPVALHEHLKTVRIKKLEQAHR